MTYFTVSYFFFIYYFLLFLLFIVQTVSHVTAFHLVHSGHKTDMNPTFEAYVSITT